MSRKRIAILFHERQREQRLPLYAIHYLSEFWRADGLEVVHLFGVEELVPADVVVVHVDTSVVPDEYLEFARRYPIAINAGVSDIRKSSFSTLRVTRDSDYAGPIIVKSDLNYAGVPEQVVGESRGIATPFGAPAEYPVYERLADVPGRFFDSPEFIVERFVPERDNGLYHVRLLDFLGNRHTCVRVSAEHHVVGVASQLGYEKVTPPPEVFEVRRRLKLDYGKIDYVMHGTRPVVLDVNKTMGAGNVTAPDDLRAMRRHRAAGIYAFLQ